MQSGAAVLWCCGAAATAGKGKLNLKLIQTNGLKSKSQTQMLICLQLELALGLAQEATSKGEKIFNIAVDYARNLCIVCRALRRVP